MKRVITIIIPDIAQVRVEEDGPTMIVRARPDEPDSDDLDWIVVTDVSVDLSLTGSLP